MTAVASRAPGGLNRTVGGASRTMGAAAGSTLALALLVCGCVFAAVAGPALSLHTRTQALDQTLAKLVSTNRTLQVNAAWSDFTAPLVQNSLIGYLNLTQAEFDQALTEFGQDFAALSVPLAAGEWASMQSILLAASGVSQKAQPGGSTPKLEVIYRQPLTSEVNVVSGTFATAAVPKGMIGVAVTEATAARFGLALGTRFSVSSVSGKQPLFVTALLTERDPSSTYWNQDPIAGTPDLNIPNGGKPYWVGGVFADPGELTIMQNAFSGPGMTMNWEYPVDTNGLSAARAQSLYNALNRATTVSPALTGKLAASTSVVTVSSPMAASLSAFLSTQAAIETVLLLLFVSLIVVGVSVIVLAARMIVAQRDVELGMLRARGGSLWQVAAVLARPGLVVALPAAVIGGLLATFGIPDGTSAPTLSWELAAVALAAALVAPPLIAVRRYRRPAPAANPARITSAEIGRIGRRRGLRQRAWRRPVAEITACAVAVAGLVVLHDQGVPAGGGIDLYLSLTPVLIAIPVVVVTLRLYPLVLRGLLFWSVRRDGATGFLALSYAARSSLTGILPAFALVLALSLASFAGMVNDGITNGEVTASWNTTGADVLIVNGPNLAPVSSTALQAIGAVHGVQHTTAVWTSNWQSQAGQQITVVAVDPASYAAVVAGTPYPAFSASGLGSGSTGTVPVLASPSAAAALGAGTTQLSSLYEMGPFSIRVAGTVSSTPAQPGGGEYVILSILSLPKSIGTAAPNTVLATGSGINDARLSAVASQVLPGADVTFRDQVLASLADSPLQHGAGLIITTTIVTAAAFGLFIIVLGLALGAADRELTMARLTVMGHDRPLRLALAETLPAVIAAIVAGLACAVILPHVIGSSIDLSAFTGTSAPVTFRPDLTALGIPAAVILVLALAALIGQARTLRRHGVAGMMRAG